MEVIPSTKYGIELIVLEDYSFTPSVDVQLELTSGDLVQYQFDAIREDNWSDISLKQRLDCPGGKIVYLRAVHLGAKLARTDLVI